MKNRKFKDPDTACDSVLLASTYLFHIRLPRLCFGHETGSDVRVTRAHGVELGHAGQQSGGEDGDSEHHSGLRGGC